MSDPTPKVWLCKHCGERVDPTLEICWSCGWDRDGKQIPLEVEVARKQYATCPECQYNLHGIGEVKACPECGFHIDRDRVDTITNKPADQQITIVKLREKRGRWMRRLNVGFFVAIALFFAYLFLQSLRQEIAARFAVTALIASLGWVVLCLIQILSILITPIDLGRR